MPCRLAVECSAMAASKNPRAVQPTDGRWLDIEEVRLVSDLRIMHAKVKELHHIVSILQDGFEESEICKYSDSLLLDENINMVDEIYLWFVRLKEQRSRSTGQS